MFSLEVPLEKSLSTSASGCRQNSFPCSRVTKSSYFLLVLGWRWPIGPCHMGFSKFTACFLKPARKGSSSRMLKRNGDHHLCVFLLTSQKFWALSTLKGHTKAWAPGGEVTGVCVLGGVTKDLSTTHLESLPISLITLTLLEFSPKPSEAIFSKDLQ